MAAHAKVICVDDACAHADDSLQRGIVQRTHTDVDSHEPDPQRDYHENITCDVSISIFDYALFLRSGIPPKDSVLITWQTQLRTELIPESKLILLDRPFIIGDTVKRHLRDHMAGMVITYATFCTLIPSEGMLNGDYAGSIDKKFIRQVPAKELKNVHKFREGDLVVYHDWLGLIEDCEDTVTIRLCNNSVVTIETPEELGSHALGDRFSTGDSVSAKKGCLRRGRWIFGAYDPNIEPKGIIVDTSTISLSISWLCRRLRSASLDATLETFQAINEPSEVLSGDDLEDVVSYDCQYPQTPGPHHHDGYQHDDLHLGERVRFKDLTGAAPQGKLQRFDINVLLVTETRTHVKVLWQDYTITEELSTDLIPDSNFDLENEVWPGDVVCTTESKTEPTEGEPDWGNRPKRIGVVQAVQPVDRIASVKWFADSEVRILNNDIMPGYRLGELSANAEDVSMYDIQATPGLNRSRGDIVMIHSGFIPAETGIEWLGEVVDIRLDGKYIVRLGLAQPPREVTLGIQDVTLAYSRLLDSDDHGSGYLSDTTYDSYFTEDEHMQDTFSDGEYFDMWYENEDGTRATVDDSGDGWTTEDDTESVDEEGDVAMRSTKPRSEREHDMADVHLRSDSEPKGHSNTSHDTDLQSATSPELSSQVNAPPSFKILEGSPPSNHHYLSQPLVMTSPVRMRRILKEHKILRSSLPEGIFVRTWDTRLDLVRVLIVGPVDTPYEYAPFIVDFHFTNSYPSDSPQAFFNSWTNGSGPVNPNLYEDGKICLSLLGTWHGDEKHENWSPARSTFLQVLVSLLGLVLVKEPYYNEAGYESRAGTEETTIASKRYSERAYFRSQGFIVHALTHPVSGFEDVIQWLYLDTEPGSPKLLDHAIEACRKAITESEAAESPLEVDGLRKISAGAVIQLRRQLDSLEKLRA
ncbi:hypothetical protein EJ05DRAFT_494856 [Pseudovirgaria hyperparasitica]|uniref:UBC core domain-containing protein n=1 Tax=Pseudovirgaria hyperparasitica TaxID=470096 RepID=A0A6A6VT59_9PEZI|nr:uncharacterized protein EJ05DRAFT_494856 [Pseudovirgaria hyperparasitica]KAF2753335.1 hypothetical protein EJ05DRAFT_494856 [Pseudovirgaria hyperparasitica]